MHSDNSFQTKIRHILRIDRALALLWESAPGWTIVSTILIWIQGILPLVSLLGTLRRFQTFARLAYMKKEEHMRYYDYLCRCLREGTENDQISEIAELSLPDWERIVQYAIRQNLAPLLYHRLTSLHSTIQIPSQILQTLQQIYLANVARNIYLYTKLPKILLTLQREHVPVLVLKGAYLEEIVYSNMGLRTMSDIDLLVKKEDLAKSQNTLIKLGYLSSEAPFPLDLHWNIDLSIADLAIDIEEIWERAQPVTISAVQVLGLCPEDLLIHLCLHLAFHHSFQFFGLRTLCDLRKVITHYAGQIQWKQIPQRAKAWGGGYAVYMVFLLAKEMLDAQIPDNVLENMRPNTFDPQFKTWAKEQMMYESDKMLSFSPYFWQLWHPGTFKEKVLLLQRLLFPPPEFISQKYPGSFRSLRNYLYYPVRLKNHVLPYIHILWRILLRDKKMLASLKQQQRNIVMREWLLSERER